MKEDTSVDGPQTAESDQVFHWLPKASGRGQDAVFGSLAMRGERG
jgi:hypothetical protein